MVVQAIILKSAYLWGDLIDVQAKKEYLLPVKEIYQVFFCFWTK